MTPELAKHYIELGHIAHKGLPMAYMEFGPGPDPIARGVYESVKCHGDTPEEALSKLVRAVKLRPSMGELHLFWRRDPSVVPDEGGGFVASCRLLTSDRCDISFAGMLEDGGILGPHLEPTLTPSEIPPEIATITIRAYGQKEEIVIVGSGDHRKPEVVDQARHDGEVILSTLDRMRDRAKAKDETPSPLFPIPSAGDSISVTWSPEAGWRDQNGKPMTVTPTS
jgi:hypothetical protein